MIVLIRSPAYYFKRCKALFYNCVDRVVGYCFRLVMRRTSYELMNPASAGKKLLSIPNVGQEIIVGIPNVVEDIIAFDITKKTTHKTD